MVLKILLALVLLPAPHLTATSYYSHKSSDQCNNCCRGIPGPQGVPGIPGLHGNSGQDGQKGTKGDEGDMGSTGLTGMRGETGPEGPKGRRGRKGVKGECGPPGGFGDKGERGAAGHPGPRGESGRKGNRGDKARRVAFMVSRDERLGPVSQKTPLSFDNIHLNIGDSFDAYSSHFICKVGGVYQFNVHVVGIENQTAYGWIMVNNDHRIAFHGDGQALHGTGSNTLIQHLKRDDHVWIQLNTNSSILNNFTSFSGHLIFED